MLNHLVQCLAYDRCGRNGPSPGPAAALTYDELCSTFVLMSPEAPRTDRELQMLEAMVDCAYALGLAVGEAAKAEAETKRSFELYDLFHRSFLAVRMGIRLSLTLRAAARAVQARVEPGAPERPEALETERPEPVERLDPVEREREQDYEPVSLPRFLSTLGLVARDAERVGGLPQDVRTRELPALQALLANAKAEPPPAGAAPAAVAVLSRPQPARAAWLGSTAAPRLRGATRPRPPPRSGSG
jgi:hypothetical protein